VLRFFQGERGRYCSEVGELCAISSEEVTWSESRRRSGYSKKQEKDETRLVGRSMSCDRRRGALRATIDVKYIRERKMSNLESFACVIDIILY